MTKTLARRDKFRGRSGPLLLVIADGIGIAPAGPKNAVEKADTPHMDKLLAGSLVTSLRAHGTAVGMPDDGDMGNSEVGHNALGAGRVFAQGAALVNDAIASGAIFKGEVWQQVEARGLAGHTVHLLGLLSDGNVHSHIDHLCALINQLAVSGITRIRVHVLTDGRDVSPRSAIPYIQRIEALSQQLADEKSVDCAIASGGGRMVITMDRYNADWTMVAKGYAAHVHGQGRAFGSASEAVHTLYEEDPDVDDQYLPPFVVVDANGNPNGLINDGDAVVLFNFRGDRAIEISRAFEEPSFDEFDRGGAPDVLFAGMLEYDGDLHIPSRYLVEPPAIDRTMGEFLCASDVRTFAVSETQKYGHVTFFWNGNRSGYIDEALETYLEIPSDRVPFNQAPAMKAAAITEAVSKLMRSGDYRFGRLNFANGDMVGHTGDFDAAVLAVEEVDRCLGQLIDVVEETDGVLAFTADHGNAEAMDRTSHTLNPVPFAIHDPGYKGEYEMDEVADAGLANIAATMMDLLGFIPPTDYCQSLIRFR